MDAVQAGKDALAVTRELKLALIVGFSLVLVVTVLISDHLSRARNDLLDNTVAHQPELTPEAPTTVVSEPPAQPDNRLATNSVQDLAGAGPAPSMSPLAQAQPPEVSMTPVEIVQSSRAQNDAYSDIRRAIEERGGLLVDGTIHLPPAAQIQDSLTPSSLLGGGSPPTPTPVTPQPESSRQATQPPSGTPAPVPVRPARDYTVVAGDSAYKIAKREYGNGELWRKLVEFNNGAIKPDGSLRIGSKIKLPAKEALTGAAVASVTPPASGPAQPAAVNNSSTAPAAAYRTYVIKKGDTLGSIASKELGTVKRAAEILELNRSVLKNPDVVPLGATIKLPARTVASR